MDVASESSTIILYSYLCSGIELSFCIVDFLFSVCVRSLPDAVNALWNMASADVVFGSPCALYLTST